MDNPIDQFSIKNGRISFEVTTLGLTAKEWKKRSKDMGYKIDDYANMLLASPDYDKYHRYEANKVIKIVLIKANEIKIESERTTYNFKKNAIKDFGEKSVSQLKGELAFLIREKFSNKELEEMELMYVIVFAKLLFDSIGRPGFLGSDRYLGLPSLFAEGEKKEGIWKENGAFAFEEN